MFELHTSDFDPCPGRAMLRRGGAFDGVAGTALVRGLMIHQALEIVHTEYENNIEDVLVRASHHTLAQMEKEGRQPSDAVIRNLDDITREMHGVLDQYVARIVPITKKWTLLGCEVPVYWELRKDVHLSSHVDILFINDRDAPVFWDWKWRVAANASISDLSRSLQLACYWSALASGEGLFQLGDIDEEGVEQIGDGWWRFDPGQLPLAKGAWVDLPSLKPYAKATIGTDDDGQACQFVKGDPRPLSRVIRYVDFKENQIDKIVESALRRADMLINEDAPFIPQGCSHCECEPWCPRFDMAE